MPSSNFPADDLVTLTVNVFVNKSLFEDYGTFAEKIVAQQAADDAAQQVKVLIARKFEDARELAS